MSADNGYILRKRAADNQFVLQMYFASNDSYPSINDDRAMTFDNVEDALSLSTKKSTGNTTHRSTVSQFK